MLRGHILVTSVSSRAVRQGRPHSQRTHVGRQWMCSVRQSKANQSDQKSIRSEVVRMRRCYTRAVCGVARLWAASMHHTRHQPVLFNTNDSTPATASQHGTHSPSTYCTVHLPTCNRRPHSALLVPTHSLHLPHAHSLPQPSITQQPLSARPAVVNLPLENCQPVNPIPSRCFLCRRPFSAFHCSHAQTTALLVSNHSSYPRLDRTPYCLLITLRFTAVGND